MNATFIRNLQVKVHREQGGVMRFYLLRHGQTDWNIENRLQGRKNMPMNSNGVRQITELADQLQKMNFQVDLIVSSPLERAKQSAEIVAEKIGFAGEIILDDDFVERSFGLAEGLVYSQEINLNDEKYGAETIEDVCTRAKIAIKKYMSSDEKSILIVAHGAILAATKHALSQGELGYYDSSVPIIQGNILCCEIRQNDKPILYNIFSH